MQEPGLRPSRGPRLRKFGGVFAQLEDDATIRRELFRIGRALREMGVTSLITAERTEDHGSISRYGVEEFVSDNVIVLRNAAR